ncbi:MAG: cobalamin B12-binding domain-containing protein [Deltaproteobacteria bacterium]|nr:cobalamin B12-binding domain-containing protein [Deltaproteobacteria bacterium]
MKILLSYISGAPGRDDPYISLLPTGLCSLHACLREAGFDASLANFSGWKDEAVIRQLETLKPDIVAISQWTHNRHASMELARLVRRVAPGCIVVMGGGHATFRYQEILRQGSPVDIVALGEAEATLVELAGRRGEGRGWSDIRGIAFSRAGEVVVNPPRPPLADLDRLPFPSSSLEHSIGVDLDRQLEFILTARGCPSACRFCSSPGFWDRRVRFRSPENIVAEILCIRDRHGLIYFSLRDDTFTADRSRTIAFCRLLIERRANILWNCQSRVNALDEELLVWMKRAGCECVQLGVESGSPRILAMLGKAITPLQVEQAAAQIRKVGINLSVYLISDVPGETEADIAQTMELIRRIRTDDGYVSPLAYYPGTRLFEEAVAAGRVSRGIFEESREAALYAAGKPGRNSRRLLRALAGHAPRDAGRFQRQKELLGYCHATNVLAGEWHRQRGDTKAAEREYREITVEQPDNPWGWYLLGELYDELGEGKTATQCYRTVLGIVPEHGPSRSALAAKKEAGP